MKAGRVCELALKAILSEAADAPPEADEYADSLDALNNYMAALEADGVVLGFTSVDNVNDEVTVPAGALQGVIANLAIELAPQFDAPIPPELTRRARDGMDTLLKLGRRSIQASLPPTLPMGAGNRGNWPGDRMFYGRTALARLALAGNARATTFTAADTPVRVVGFWQTPASQGYRTDINGRVTNVASVSIAATTQVTLSATGGGVYTFHLMRDGVPQASVAATLSAAPASVTLSHSVDLDPEQYLEVWVEADGHTEPCTVVEAQIKVGC